MTDLPVWDLDWLLQGSVNYPDLQESDRRMTIALTCFLQEHGLLKRTMLKPGEDPPRDFIIRHSDLTPEGRVFHMSGAVDRWLRANDDVRKPLSMRSLERSLKKIRSD